MEAGKQENVFQPFEERVEGYRNGLGVGPIQSNPVIQQNYLIDEEQPEIPLINRRFQKTSSNNNSVTFSTASQIIIQNNNQGHYEIYKDLDLRIHVFGIPIFKSIDSISNFFKTNYKYILGGTILICASYFAYKKWNEKKDYLKLFRQSLIEDERKEIKIVLEKFDEILKNNNLQELREFYDDPEIWMLLTYDQSYYLKEFIKSKNK